ncbi:MAG: carbonic anhydrase [Candidatus Lokiarchaeota archaeon]|nr:carbonic anhydrase [Candidatus Lokiarchaeota archaeon]
MVTIDEALERLRNGNKRFIEGDLECNIGEERRLELKGGQSPFATILGCSDSRVPIELIFDQGLGELFIIRTAGNIIDDIALGSLEYGGAHCNTPVLMVLGHQDCGAVGAAAKGDPLQGSMQKIADNIQPVLDSVDHDLPFDELVDQAVRKNIERVIEDIKNQSPLLQGLAETGKMKFVGAYYSFDTGEVEFFL